MRNQEYQPMRKRAGSENQTRELGGLEAVVVEAEQKWRVALDRSKATEVAEAVLKISSKLSPRLAATRTLEQLGIPPTDNLFQGLWSVAYNVRMRLKTESATQADQVPTPEVESEGGINLERLRKQMVQDRRFMDRQARTFPLHEIEKED
jgi:hypothetical protein